MASSTTKTGAYQYGSPTLGYYTSYNDAVAAASKPVATPTPTPTATTQEPTASQVYGSGFSAPDAAPDTYAARTTYLNDNPIDEDGIRQKTISQFQGEIDATNKIYADMLQQAQVQGQAKIGSGTAIQARSGLLGSDFGAAQKDNIVTANTAVENSIRDELAAKVAAIMGKANGAAADEIAAKRKAQQDGLDAYLSYIGSKGDRTKSNLGALATSFLAQDVDPTKLDANTLASLAAKYGVQTGDILTAYKTASDTKAQTDAKNKLDADKTQADIDKTKSDIANAGYFNLNEGEARYYVDPTTGQTKLLASKAKTYAPKDDGTSRNGYSLTADDKRTLIGGGFSAADIANVQSDIAVHGLDAVKNNPSNTPGMKKALETVFNVKTDPSQNRFLSQDYFKSIFNTADLESAAKAAKFTNGGVFNNKPNVDNYLTDLMHKVEAYRTAGYSDQRHLKNDAITWHTYHLENQFQPVDMYL